MNFFEIHFSAGTYMRYYRMLRTAAIELQRERACVGLHIGERLIIYQDVRNSYYTTRFR